MNKKNMCSLQVHKEQNSTKSKIKKTHTPTC